MGKKMLIDATHPEETRVVVVDGNKVDDFDFESINKCQLSGNIYLAKVTRVEPSLQATFVDYGGNRHGFLPFSEIHPDYYQIPVADRQMLLEEEERAAREENADENGNDGEGGRKKPRRSRRSRGKKAQASLESDEQVADPGAARTERGRNPRNGAGTPGSLEIIDDGDSVESEPAIAETDAMPTADEAPSDTIDPIGEVFEGAEEPANEIAKSGDSKTMTEGVGTKGERITEDVESIGPEDLQGEAAASRARHRRNYKIQDVIKVRQILLVQVVKEERGNKGAALTTYLSLAGRYCVLMPNTARGGGVSRKILQAGHRKRLREIMDELEVPKGMGLIARTAGAERTKVEIKRDYEFLSRQWEQTRDLTMKSIAPCLIYEEGSLIKRSIRDIYTKDIDSIFVEGENGYREAKEYMKMLMPSHAKNVQQYVEQIPLFTRYQAESTLNGMFSPTVQLKSGGYIVISLTEALVAVDVNSGRATKQGSIEETALQTNLEAADEVARQCRLRDLAGLIVIDFIDMDENRNNRAVEKRMKERLKTDRARIQIGRISSFGLMEMSRQRLRPGMLEATTSPCRHCQGMGVVRSDENVALSILREVEEEGVRGRSNEIQVVAPVDVANFLLNRKRGHIAQIEERYGISVLIVAEPSLISQSYSVGPSKQTTQAGGRKSAVVTAISSGAVSENLDEDASENRESEKKREGRSRRRGQRGGRKKSGTEASQGEKEAAQSDAKATSEPSDGNEDKPKRSRRRRRNKDGKRAEADNQALEGETVAKKADAAENNEPTGNGVSDKVQEKKSSTRNNEVTTEDTQSTSEPVPAPESSAQPKRRGWWSMDI